MAGHLNRYRRKLVTILASNRFFWGVLALFVLEAVWIAASGNYPMAFDEDFHFGIIRLYAHHASPFWAGQPAHAENFGAVSHDPSYLYHWLMSFPYRAISAVTSNQAAQIMTLRVINIAFFGSALIVYRRLLAKTGASRTIVNFCLLLFVLVPIVPLLAAQINYDNLLLPLTGLSLIFAINAANEMRQTKRINMKDLLSWLAVSLAACLVKYAFLPIFAVEVIYLAASAWSSMRRGRFWVSVGFGMTLMSRRLRAALILLCAVLLVMFMQRYGVNFVRYHTPIPDCGAVLSAQECSAYAPWNRDYQLSLHKDPSATGSPLIFGADWFYGMWLRTFFAVDGPASNFATRGPLILPAFGAIALSGIGLVATIVTWRRLSRRYDRTVLWLFVAVIGVYAGALWVEGYKSFLQTGQAVAINGRYLLLIMPLLLILLALGTNELLKKRETLKAFAAAIAVICMIWGGGALTYVLRSSDNWYWPGSPLRGANNAIRHTIGPVVPGYYSPTEFMGKN